MDINLNINGEQKIFRCQPGELLRTVLRREGFFSVRFGSDTGETGASAVLLDGRLVNTDTLLAAQADGEPGGVEPLAGDGHHLARERDVGEDAQHREAARGVEVGEGALEGARLARGT